MLALLPLLAALFAVAFAVPLPIPPGDEWDARNWQGNQHRGPHQHLTHPGVPSKWHREFRGIEQKFHDKKWNNNDLFVAQGEVKIQKFSLEPIPFTSPPKCYLTIESNIGLSDKNVEIDCPTSTFSPLYRAGSQGDIHYSVRKPLYNDNQDGYDVCVTFEPSGNLCTFVEMRGTQGANLPAPLKYSEEWVNLKKIKHKFGGGTWSDHEIIWDHPDRAKFDMPYWGVTASPDDPNVVIEEDNHGGHIKEDSGLTIGRREPFSWNAVFPHIWRSKERTKRLKDAKKQAAEQKASNAPPDKVESARQKWKDGLDGIEKSRLDFKDTKEGFILDAKNLKNKIKWKFEDVSDWVSDKRKEHRQRRKNAKDKIVDKHYQRKAVKQHFKFSKKIQVDEKAKLDAKRKEAKKAAEKKAKQKAAQQKKRSRLSRWWHKILAKFDPRQFDWFGDKRRAREAAKKQLALDRAAARKKALEPETTENMDKYSVVWMKELPNKRVVPAYPNAQRETLRTYIWDEEPAYQVDDIGGRAADWKKPPHIQAKMKEDRERRGKEFHDIRRAREAKENAEDREALRPKSRWERFKAYFREFRGEVKKPDVKGKGKEVDVKGTAKQPDVKVDHGKGADVKGKGKQPDVKAGHDKAADPKGKGKQPDVKVDHGKEADARGKKEKVDVKGKGKEIYPEPLPAVDVKGKGKEVDTKGKEKEVVDVKGKGKEVDPKGKGKEADAKGKGREIEAASEPVPSSSQRDMDEVRGRVDEVEVASPAPMKPPVIPPRVSSWDSWKAWFYEG